MRTQPRVFPDGDQSWHPGPMAQTRISERKAPRAGERALARLPQTRHHCGFSQLNPHEFIGGFEGLAIAYLHGSADERSGLGRPKRISNPHRATVGRDRAAPSNCGAEAQPNSSPVLSPLGSAVLDLVLALVAAMARKPGYRPGRDGLALAPYWLVSTLAISIPGSLARWAPHGFL
jgi:hypothetical protein